MIRKIVEYLDLIVFILFFVSYITYWLLGALYIEPGYTFFVGCFFLSLLTDVVFIHLVEKLLKKQKVKEINEIESFLREEENRMEDIVFLKEKRYENFSLAEWKALLEERDKKFINRLRAGEKKNRICMCCQERIVMADMSCNDTKKMCVCPSMKKIEEKGWV